MSTTTPTYTESQVSKFVGLLLGGNTPDAVAARAWLNNRGITGDMIAHYQLGLMYAGISIPIPTGRGDYYIKRRVNPWGGEKSWTQKGIPAMVFFTHQPEGATKTYLCEGEWDALLLGWLLKDDPTIAVATFTCGCQTIPSEGYLEQLPGEVVIFYDRDEAGERGAHKLAQRLGNRLPRFQHHPITARGGMCRMRSTPGLPSMTFTRRHSRRMPWNCQPRGN